MAEEFRAHRDNQGRPSAQVFDTEFLKKKAEFTKELVLKAATNGDDVVGSAKDICDFVEALFNEFKIREWVMEIPTPEELKKQLDARDSAAAAVAGNTGE